MPEINKTGLDKRGPKVSCYCGYCPKCLTRLRVAEWREKEKLKAMEQQKK